MNKKQHVTEKMISFWLDGTIHKAIKDKAEKEERTLVSQLRYILQAWYVDEVVAPMAEAEQIKLAKENF